MRPHQFALVALLGLSVPTALYAQSTGGSSTGRTDQGGTTTTTTSRVSSTSTSSGSGWFGGNSHWVASGFVGANYSNNSSQMSGSTNVGSTGSTSSNSQRSVDYGASVGYLWHNAVGGEFLASFTPNFQMQNALAPVGSEP